MVMTRAAGNAGKQTTAIVRVPECRRCPRCFETTKVFVQMQREGAGVLRPIPSVCPVCADAMDGTR